MIESITIPVFSVKQEIGEFYTGVVRADDLLRVCKFDYRRMHFSGGYINFLGIQRNLDQKRVDGIERYIKSVDASFPTSIVLSVDENCAELNDSELEGFKFLTIKEYRNQNSPELDISLDESTAILDGQHRLKGLEQAGKDDFEVPVSIFIGADDATAASLFSVVNLAQTKVNKSLVYDLFALAKNRSPEKTCHEIVVALDRLERSPFYESIKRLGAATEGRFGETLSQATVVKGILPYISDDPELDRDRGKRLGFWEPALQKDLNKRIFYPFFQMNQDEIILGIVINYFSAIRSRWEAAWRSSGRGVIIRRTNGFNAFARFLRPAYLSIATKPELVSEDDFIRIFSRVSLVDDDFNSVNFVPGSSGAKSLYDKLMFDTGL